MGGRDLLNNIITNAKKKKKLYREYPIAGIYTDHTVAVLPLGPWI